jgi:hypothetical protein
MMCCVLSTCWCGRLHVPDGTLMWWTSGPRGTDGQARYASRLAATRSAAGRSGGTEPKGTTFLGSLGYSGTCYHITSHSMRWFGKWCTCLTKGEDGSVATRHQQSILYPTA